ncbi:hypothetical protein V7S43_001342 [Phytophthora oleae]|uniref:Uncharacterized protein n=1 Tax=Phytophthora oleae TaxID=2107226 RepID=A0ABD3G3U4_9STRA
MPANEFQSANGVANAAHGDDHELESVSRRQSVGMAAEESSEDGGVQEKLAASGCGCNGQDIFVFICLWNVA